MLDQQIVGNLLYVVLYGFFRTVVCCRWVFENSHLYYKQGDIIVINKVTSLQALLRKAFRLPGVLVLGDFGFSAYFFLVPIGKNKPKMPHLFA